MLGTEFAMAKILVTGGAGFIGSHVVDELLARGFDVVVLDDLSTGKLENLPLENEHLRIIEGSILDKVKVSDALRDCSAVIHLAAIASVQASVDAPQKTHQVNFDGSLLLIQAAKEIGGCRFIFASSAAVYGDASSGSLTESTPVDPLTPYAIDKLASEYYLNYYHRSFGIESTVFRFFNVFGPRQNPSSPYSGVISIFRANCALGKPLTIFGDGKQTRDFVFVKDLAKILADSIFNQKTCGQTINIGTGKSVSLLDIASTIGIALNMKIELLFRPSRSGDIKHSEADISLLQSLFDEITFTSLDYGLAMTLGKVV
jgi:UDP-glucose 4-epimerase